MNMPSQPSQQDFRATATRLMAGVAHAIAETPAEARPSRHEFEARAAILSTENRRAE